MERERARALAMENPNCCPYNFNNNLLSIVAFAIPTCHTPTEGAQIAVSLLL